MMQLTSRITNIAVVAIAERLITGIASAQNAGLQKPAPAAAARTIGGHPDLSGTCISTPSIWLPRR